jgi:FG-GAP-like repeat/ASPIC and UnbV
LDPNWEFEMQDLVAARIVSPLGRANLRWMVGATSFALIAGCSVPKYFGPAMVDFEGENQLEVLRELNATAAQRGERKIVLDGIVPFEELDAFDADAKSWSNMFSMMDGDGVCVFDANGDGRVDVYIVQDGQNWTRPTDANGVLTDKPRYQASMLYVNQGNDPQGKPIFKSLKQLAAENPTHQHAELLIENYLFPREHAADSTERFGRAATTAIAADFDGNGLPDLLVGAKPSGMVWSDPQMRGIQTQFIDPIGRQVRKSPVPLTPLGQSLVHCEPRYSFDDQRASSRGQEPEGANSLFLNLGDQDGDGLPEWKDVSRDANIEGCRPTSSLSVADFDLDGDLDVFETNRMDEDCWVGSSPKLAGAANCLYVNRLADSGRLVFEEIGKQTNTDGVFDEDNPMPEYYRLKRLPLLPDWMSMMFRVVESYQPEFVTMDGVECEKGQITWCSVPHDVDDDGRMDLWVGDDMGGALTLFYNESENGVIKFTEREHARSVRGGNWMSFAPADFDGDLREDLFAGNSGGGVLNASMSTFPMDLVFDPPIMVEVAIRQFFADKVDGTHAIIDGKDWTREWTTQVDHSAILPPDNTIPTNIVHPLYEKLHERGLFDESSLDPYEFAWGSPALDVQNDGKPDIYITGGLSARGGFMSVMGINPGRLLINDTEGPGGALRFIDQTAEHHAFNIHEMRYDTLAEEGYIWRPAPTQAWPKRDVVYNYDRSVWSTNGPVIQERVVNQDMLQTAENGRAALGADLNGDGFADILLRNKGGYDSRASNAQNLKAMVDGKAQVVPSHHASFPAPTNYEPGSTRVFLNRYTPETGGNWLKVKLVDDSGTLNKDAIGAKVVVDGKHLKYFRPTDGSFVSTSLVPLLFGIGEAQANVIEVRWPDAARTVTRHQLGGIANTTVTISRTQGVVR